MKAKCSIVFSVLIALGSGPVMAQEVSPYSAAEVRDALFNAVSAIEEVAGLEPRASRALSALRGVALERLFASIPNKEQFVASALQIVDRIDLARMRSSRDNLVLPIDVAPSLLSSSATAPYQPNYSSGDEINYVRALLLGLVDLSSDRCEGLDIYANIIAGVELGAIFLDNLCTAAGCDPTGIACIVICGLVEVYNLVIEVLNVPIQACQNHGANVDSAEIEAAYENTVLILGDLAASVGSLDGETTAATDAGMRTRVDRLDAVVTTILANQMEIIRLLQNQQGRAETKSANANRDSLRRSGD